MGSSVDNSKRGVYLFCPPIRSSVSTFFFPLQKIQLLFSDLSSCLKEIILARVIVLLCESTSDPSLVSPSGVQAPRLFDAFELLLAEQQMQGCSLTHVLMLPGP